MIMIKTYASACDYVEAGGERKKQNRPMLAAFNLLLGGEQPSAWVENQPSSWVVNKIGRGLDGKQPGRIRVPSLPCLLGNSRSNHLPIAAWSLFLLIVICSFELLAGTDMQYH